MQMISMRIAVHTRLTIVNRSLWIALHCRQYNHIARAPSLTAPTAIIIATPSRTQSDQCLYAHVTDTPTDTHAHSYNMIRGTRAELMIIAACIFGRTCTNHARSYIIRTNSGRVRRWMMPAPNVCSSPFTFLCRDVFLIQIYTTGRQATDGWESHVHAA